MKKYVVIFSIKYDQHADRIESYIKKNATPIRLNLDEVHAWKLFSSENRVFIKTKEQTIDMKDICSVFVRRIPSFDAFLKAVPTELEAYADFIAKQEFQLFTDCLAILDENLFFMNPMKSARNLGKAVQQHIASRAGLLTPETYIGSDTNIAYSFIKKLRLAGKRVSTKPISNAKVEIDGVQSIRFTELLEREDEGHLDTLSSCPVIFQEYIEKKYEIRGTFVHGTILASSIHSQEADNRTAIDWRHYNLAQTPHYEIQLPHHIEDKLIKFHNELEVHYSAFDMIVTPSDEYYILETNPYGQWLWIEDLTGLQITNTIAEALIRAK
jgi:glutathione synthase/RimK-type ligase-like ATP-grasp enzyme